MPLPTPPQPLKRGLFATSQKAPVYYEDVYGHLNSDEELEGGPQLCESDSESDDDNQPITSPKAPATSRNSQNTDTSPLVQELVSDPETSEEEHEYRMAPSINRKRSTLVIVSIEHQDSSTKEDLVPTTVQVERAPAVIKKQGRKKWRPARSAHRQLLKAQLAEVDLLKKPAQRNERLAEKAKKKNKVGVGKAGVQVSKAPQGTAFVAIDLRGIDTAQYVYIPG